MAAFQSLAIHFLKNHGNGFNTKGSVTSDVVPLSYEYKIGTHTQTHTQIQSHTLSLTHLHTLPQTLPLTHSRTSTLFCESKQGAFGPMEACKRQISSDVLAFCIQYHQNRPNINKMAAFQSLALSRCRRVRGMAAFQSSATGLRHMDVVPLS
jgi:hypothetical protein